MNTIHWTRKAVKQLKRLHRPDQPVIYEAVQGLCAMPHAPQVRALANHQFGYRLRVGNYRVLFNWDGDIRIVSIEEVRKRDERTY